MSKLSTDYLYLTWPDLTFKDTCVYNVFSLIQSYFFQNKTNCYKLYNYLFLTVKCATINNSLGQSNYWLSVSIREQKFDASLIVWLLMLPHSLSDSDQKFALLECNWTSCCPFPADVTFYLTPPIVTWLPKCAKSEIQIPFHFTSGCEANHSTRWVISMIRV